MNDRYQGTRPHAETAVVGTQADVDLVVKNNALKRLDNLLAAADSHAEYGRFADAKVVLDAARPMLDEVLAVAATGQSAYDETCRRCMPPSIEVETLPVDESPDEPDKPKKSKR